MPHNLLSLLGYTETGLTTAWAYKGEGKGGRDKGKKGLEEWKNEGEGTDLTLKTEKKRGTAD
jgi:hypothetical protein